MNNKITPMDELDFSPLEGTIDFFPDDHNYYTFLKKVFRHEFRRNGFRRISTPMVEREDLYENIFGDNKDDYMCKCASGTIRENSHIGIMRAFLNGGFYNGIKPVYYYYMDRQYDIKGGKYKESHQIGAEILGENDPILDAILIYINYDVLKNIGLSDKFEIRVNSMGLEKERVKYKEELISFYDNKRHILSEDFQNKLDTNPIAVLSSKDEDEQILAEGAPKMTKFLKKHSKAHYTKFIEYLDLLKVPYIEDHKIISEYDYATNTVWEIADKEDGTIISKGFRYDDLSKKFGVPPKEEVPAAGFHTNVLSLINKLKENNIRLRDKDDIDLYFVQLGDEAKKVVLPLSLKSREKGINTVVSLGTPSLKEQMLKAQRSNAKYIVMVGVMEARNGIFQVRDSVAGTQAEVQKEDIIDYVIDKIGKDKLDFYSPARDLIVD